MATQYSSPPARLKQRGLRFTPAQWRRYTPQQRRDIIRQSDELARKSRRAGMSPAHRRDLARRRARYYARKPAIDRHFDWPGDDEETEFWEGYRDYMGYQPGERHEK